MNENLWTILVIISAVVCRILSKIGFGFTFFSLLRSMLYIALYIGKGFSVGRRVIHKSVRHYLILIFVLMVFWFSIRTIKYFFIKDAFVSRHLWYAYYLPMLFIPLMAVFVSIQLGKPENTSLPKWAKLMYLPTVIGVLLVMSNDWHQLVFSFPEEQVWADYNQSYEIGYYFIFIWEILCAVFSFSFMVYKSRLSQRKKYFPAALLLCAVVYALLYASGVEWMQMIAGDLTAAQCVLYTIILESYIQSGLIQTNTEYEELFQIGTIGAQITDKAYHICHTSSKAKELSNTMMHKAVNENVKLDKNTLLKSSSICGGYVFWQEDISDITKQQEKLEENRKALEDSNDLALENYKTKVKINSLKEKNRLYDEFQKKTEKQIHLLDDLLERYKNETDELMARRLLATIGVIGAYIKRRGNLLFIEEKTPVVDITELSACLKESFTKLQEMGIECAVDVDGGEYVFVGEIAHIYERIETMIETSLDTICCVWVKGREEKDFIQLHIEIECETDLSEFGELAVSSSFEDGIWNFLFFLKKEEGSQ